MGAAAGATMNKPAWHVLFDILHAILTIALQHAANMCTS